MFAQDAQPTIRTEVRLINLSVAALDASSNRMIDGLTREDFAVYEDGVAQKVEFFSRGEGLPLSLALVMDNSGSQSKFVKQHRKDVRTFLRKTLRPAQHDQAALVAFANSVRLVHDFGADSDALVDAVEQYTSKPTRFPVLGPEIRRDLGSAVYDGIYHAIRQKLAKSDSGRRALLLFSDGEDNSSEHHMLEVLEAAQDAGVVIYCIHYLENRQFARSHYGQSVMMRLARDTGGEYFEAAEGQLEKAFARIEEQLRSSYQMAYRSSNIDRPGSFRNVQVRTMREGVRLRHRTGYFTE